MIRSNKRGMSGEIVATLVIIILLVFFMFIVIPGIWDFRNTLSSFKQFVGIGTSDKIEMNPTSDITQLGCDGLIKYMDQQMDSDKRIQVYEQYVSQKCSADSLSGFALLETGKAYRKVMGTLPDIYEKANSLITSGNDKLHNEESEYYLALIKREHDLVYQDKIIVGTKTPEFNNAQKLFENFKAKYPKSKYASEATFYLGEMEIKFGITNEGQGGNTQTPIKKEFYLLSRDLTLIDFNCKGYLETQQFRCSNMDSAIKLLEDYLKYDSSIFLVKNEEEARKYLSLMKGDLNYLESEYAKTKSRTDLGKILFMYSQKLHPNKVTDGNIVYNKFLNFLTDNLITHTTITESNSNYNPHLTATTLAESHYRAYLYYTKINNKENADKALNEAMSIANSYGIEDFKTKLSTLTYNSLIYPDSPEELRNPSFLKYLNAKWPSPPTASVPPESTLLETAKTNKDNVLGLLDEITENNQIVITQENLPIADSIILSINGAIERYDSAIRSTLTPSEFNTAKEDQALLYYKRANIQESKAKIISGTDKTNSQINALESYREIVYNYPQTTAYTAAVDGYRRMAIATGYDLAKKEYDEAVTLLNQYTQIKNTNLIEKAFELAYEKQNRARMLLINAKADLKYASGTNAVTLAAQISTISKSKFTCVDWFDNSYPYSLYPNSLEKAIERCKQSYNDLEQSCEYTPQIGYDSKTMKCAPA